MPFDWAEKFRAALRGWRERMQRLGVTSSYAMVTSSALWPVAAAVQNGDWSALVTLGGVLGGSVGGNLIANQIQKWQDQADGARQIAALPQTDPLREHLDAVLEKLNAFAEARAALPESDHQWFADTVRAELTELGNLQRFAPQVFGDGNVILSGSVERSVVVTGDHNLINTGPGAIASSGAVAAGQGGVAIGHLHGDIHQHNPASIPSGPDLLSGYLTWLINECAPLRLKAIDQGAGRPGREPLGLANVYVDLNLDFRVRQQDSLAKHLARRNEEEPLAHAETQERSQDLRVVAALEALALHPRLVLLGAPGSGKSTLSAYLALSLAQAMGGDPKPLERMGEWWKAGPLLPVRVILRQYASSLPSGPGPGRAEHLWNFIGKELKASGLPEATAKRLRQIAADTGALFLLDGLDEARDAVTRRRVLEAVAEFSTSVSSKSRVLLTSRPYAWDEGSRSPDAGTAAGSLFDSFAAYRLAEFDAAQIDTFIVRWYDAIRAAGWIGGPEAVEKTRNLQVAVKRRDLEILARNPLLLTLMATLHSNRTRLPDDRADLYDEVVELLLQRWNETSGADRGLLDALAIPTLKLSDLREVIQQLAFRTHEKCAGQDGVADIAEGDLLAALRELTKDTGKASLALDYIEKRAGLLLGQGESGAQRQFTFPHRTFQEYLAACFLAGQHDFCTRAADLARGPNPAHWREVLTLAARHAEAGRGVPAADALVHCQSLLEWSRQQPAGERDWRAAVLAGEQLLEIGLAAVDSRAEYRVVRDRVAEWMVGVLETSSLPAVARARAGNVLARLGDPRRHLVPKSIEDLGAMQFCYVPGGPFIMGDGEGRHRNAALDKGYWISRFPISVAQYGLFVTGARSRETARLGEPFDYLNHPVVGVDWSDCLAFCRWLNGRFNSQLPEGYSLVLPSEAEWEKAARGGLQIPASAVVRSLRDGLLLPESMPLTRNDSPERAYPWKGDFTVDKANTFEAQIRATSPSGCFAKGAGPYGTNDLAGNVWEWTRSLYQSYPYSRDDGRERLQLSRGGNRVLRGGAWNLNRDFARCAYRNWYDPSYRIRYFGFRVVASPFSSLEAGPSEL